MPALWRWQPGWAMADLLAGGHCMCPTTGCVFCEPQAVGRPQAAGSSLLKDGQPPSWQSGGLRSENVPCSWRGQAGGACLEVPVDVGPWACGRLPVPGSQTLGH